MYDIRAVLESVLVERFVERATQSQLDRLDESVEDFARHTAGTDDIRIVLDAKDKIYEVLIEGADSPSLKNIIEGIQARVRLLRATSMGEPGRAEIAAEELRAVVVAARKREAKVAAELCATPGRHAATTALTRPEERSVGTEWVRTGRYG